MSCINYPSNYRVIMETNAPTVSNQPPPTVKPLSPIQCSCQRSFQQQQQQQQQENAQHPRQHQQHQQLKPQSQAQPQQQQVHLYQPQQQKSLEPLAACLQHQPAEQASTYSKSSPQDSQNSQASTTTSVGPFCKSYYKRVTSEPGGQLSCRYPFEISVSTAHASARRSYEKRLPSGMTSACGTDRNSMSEEEFYSLNSASSDRDDCMPQLVRQIKGGDKEGLSIKGRFKDCECASPVEENYANSNTSPPRNVAILQLLREVVQLINQTDENGSGCGCGVASTKMRNIAALGSEESVADNGPFSTGFKITYTPSRKGTSPSASCAHTEQSEPHTMGPPINIPLQLPCNLIITPNFLTCAPCPYAPISATKTTQHMQIAAAPEEPTKSTAKKCFRESTAEEFCNSKSKPCSCIGDLELIEEIAALALASDCKNYPEPSSQACEADDRYRAGEINIMSGGKACPAECNCNQPCVCPVHGFYMPVAAPCEPSVAHQCSQPIDEEECECMSGEDAGIITEPCQSQTHISTAPSATTNGTKKSDDSECDCCHCQAMRDKQNCMTITSMDKAREQCSCSELKFFIDSIIMDLDAMEKARRKKQVEQNVTPTRAKMCPRQSFPVTITEVTDLGATSLYVKWVIHDCYGIAGYEIYVDGYLTNRYFHCNHEAAVVCDVDVTKTHKVVLVAQPKQADCSCGDGTENKGKELMRKSDADKMDKAVAPSALWTPSIYLYDPCDKKDGPPMNRGNI